jgi:hypothetical protein
MKPGDQNMREEVKRIIDLNVIVGLSYVTNKPVIMNAALFGVPSESSSTISKLLKWKCENL